MVKKCKESLKSNSNKLSKGKKLKNKLNLVTIKGNRKRKIKKTFYDQKEFVTDLSFIDKYEEDEKNRIKFKEKEYLIDIQNKKLYYLKICFRPLTNNIELLGKYIEENNNINKSNNNNSISDKNNKCSYLLIQDNNIIAPILYENFINTEKCDNVNDNSNVNEKKESIGNQKINKKKRIKKNLIKNKNKYFYLHICKKNLINCLLLSEYSIINYILIFLSGMYSGYFEELNKNNILTLKVDTFNIFLNLNNTTNNNDFYDIEVFGKGKDEYGEYVIKGNMSLITNVTQYQKENSNITENKNNKVVYFGSLFFHKNYNLK